MADSFVKQVGTDFVPDREENVYEGIFSQYEHVVIQSLITSFGLDFLVQDQYGGDVDTIHNVRKIGDEKNMYYKNGKNRDAYEQRGDYSYGDYHGNPHFSDKKHEARERWQQTGENIKDEYTSGSIGFYGHTKSISPDKKAELDHIVECAAIHNDRGRCLSGITGTDLANSDDNLAWTNKSINASMGSWAKNENARYKKEHGCDAPMDKIDMVAYLEAYPNMSSESKPDIDEETRERMLHYYRNARKSYEAKLARAYYTSPAFFKDTSKAAAKVGVAMGLRQALGLVFSEVWFAVKDEIKAGKDDGKALFNSIAHGVKQGFCNAKEKYKELWHKFIEGAVSGVLASLTTTICNIFFSTAKNLVRIIRQSWASLVEATKILLFNPDCMPFGEQVRAATKIIATGASVVLGSMVGDAIAETGIGAIPVVGEIVQTFCSTLVTGILSCSLLYLLDRDQTINKVVNTLNSIPTVDDIVNYYKMQARFLEEYCAKLMSIDLEKFKKEIASYSEAMSLLETATSQQELNVALKKVYAKLGLPSPYGKYDNINAFMADSNSHLTFC